MSKLNLYLHQLRYATHNTRRFAHQHYAAFDTFSKDIASYVKDLSKQRILDLGCGKLYWFSLLLHSCQANVTGIDIEVVEPSGRGLGKYGRLLQHNGLERTLKTLCWDVIYSRAYYDEMAKVATFPLKFDKLDLRQMDATQLDFGNDTFDLTVSHEVFEHLPDVPDVLSDMRRTMKPDAIAYIYIHNYTSLSGGHHIQWKYPDTTPPDDVPPWDHLRENRFPNIPSYINRLRLEQYRQMFEAEFEIVEWRLTNYEGEQFLTPDIREELAEYSEEELLTKGVIVIARPKP